MKNILKYLYKYWKLAIFAPILMLTEVSIDLIQPLLTQQIIDIGIKNNDIKFVLITGLIMVGLSLLGLIGGIGCGVFSVTAAQNAGADIREDLFKNVQSFSFKNLDEMDTGNLITVLTNDVVQIQHFFTMSLKMMVRAPLMLIGSIVMTLYVSLKLGVILVVLVIILMVFVFIIMTKARPLFSKVQNKIDTVNTVMLENLRGIRVVKAFVRGDYEIERFSKVNEDLKDAMTKASKIMAFVLPLIMLIFNLGTVLILWIGGVEVLEGTISVGEVVAVINYVIRLLGAFMVLGMIFFQISRAGVSTNRIVNVLNKESYINEVKNSTKEFNIKGEIEFRNVDFSYSSKNDDLVLNNISFKVNKGETLAILGSTGAGKSTLINLIPRFYDVTSGEVLIDGYNVKEIPNKVLRKNISIALQKSIIFSGTIEDNIKYGASDSTEEEVLDAASYAQAMQFIDKMKNGLKTFIGQRGVNLSGGQKQRISIARALMVKPKILILDDSTSAVDINTAVKIQNSLKEKFFDTTIIIVAQRISSVLDADRIIVLENGSIVGEGRHEELIQKSDVYKDIYKSQLGEEV